MNKQRRNRIAEALELISQARDILEEVKDEEQESYENLPESLQYGERGEQMQENVDSLEEFIGYAKTGETTGKGVFTIVEVKAGQGASVGWGRLKSGAGWISLDYATRLA